MEKQKVQNKLSRKCYSQEYKAEVLVLAEKVGVAEAAKQLGLHEIQLYNWRGKDRLLQTQSETE